MQYISWSQPNSNDRWSSVRDFFNGFNDRRCSMTEPSEHLTIDESMSMNRTNRTIKNSVPSGLPHQTKIARKPEGVGSEIRCLVDGQSQIMLRLEIQESKEEMATKPFFRDIGKASTAGVLRLTEPWFNSGRTVYGDSAFGSVLTASKLREHGLHFFGLVKTAHREFPLNYFKSLGIPARSGESRYLTAMKNDFPLIAAAWFDKKTKFFIATAGTNGAAPPHNRTRYRLLPDGNSEKIVKSTPMSSIPYEYFSFSQKVDVHNHRRQGILAMERVIHTQNWAFRLICTVLGMIMVDAYMIYKYENEENIGLGSILSFIDFVAHVSGELVKNTLVDGVLGRKRMSGELVPF